MICKSKKTLSEPLKRNSEFPGPGEYLPLTKNKKIQLYKEPFLSTINGTFIPRNNFPGPGAYYNDDFLNKYLKNNINEKTINNNKANTKYNYPNGNKPNLGFNSTAKRFNKLIINNPGPGQYFPKINKFLKNKLDKIKKEEFNSKKRQKGKILNKIDAISSIPSKDQKYGFNILEDGKIIKNKDPNLSKSFTGEKGDSVGPGSYEIEKKDELYKTRPLWTMSKDVRNCYITNWENLSKLESPSLISTNYNDPSTNLNNSNILSSITANKFFVDDNLNVFELSPYNISNYDSKSNFSKSLSFNFSNIKKNKINIKNPKLNLYIYKEKFKKIPSRQIFKINNNPGPGSYINRFKHSSFYLEKIPESRQFFGSGIERFHSINNSYNEGYEDSYLIDKYNRKLNKLVPLIPFNSKEKRFNTPNYLKEKFSNPSPFAYNNSKIKKAKSFSNFEVFNTSSKRFIEGKNVKWLKEVPGPGYYNPDEIKGHISTKVFIKGKNENESKSKENDYIIPINYKINTIEYLNNKNVNSTNLKNVAFFKCNPIIKKSSSHKNIELKHYIEPKKSGFKKIYPPFNSFVEKKIEFNSQSDINIGPGQYNHDSYFDWNKKTYNISYA